MNYKKRLVITSLISIILVSVLFLGSTYSIFTSSDVDENLNSYTTGNLVVSVTESGTVISDLYPISLEEANTIAPYHITVRNTGNVPYMFDVILADTTAGDVIDYQYLYTQVGKLEPKILNDCTSASVTVNDTNYTGRVIKSEVIVPAQDKALIDVRVWISDKVQNTEMGKSFYGKLLVDGKAIYDYNDTIDNSMLIAGDSLSSVTPGSYVKYVGNNGCPDGHCDGTNANYVSDSDKGYCSSSSYKFSVNGWRVGYIKDESAYLVSSGAPECIKTYSESKSSSTSSREFPDSLTYLTSSTATKDTDTSTFSLDDPTASYTFPTDISSLNQKFTCSNDTDGTCTTLYSISTDSTNQSLTLNKYNTGSCTTSASSSSSNYYSCLINSYQSSTSSRFKYWGTSYILTKGGFKLSGTLTSTTSYKINQYTCKSSSSTAICTTLYYATDNGHAVSTGSSTSVYVSYKKYSFNEYAAYYNRGKNYVFGSNYEFNVNTGKYTLTNTATLSWGNDYTTIISDKKYTCFDDSGSDCSTMYEITGDSTSTKAVYYTYTSSGNVNSHITHLNDVARTYCNVNYAYGGVCNEDSAWAMNVSDFEQITGSPLYYNSSSDKSCYNVSGSTACGYGNDLIDNGGYYWYATPYGSASAYTFYWYPNARCVNNYSSNRGNGVRPVLRLASTVQVISGSGTYEDPYILFN